MGCVMDAIDLNNFKKELLQQIKETEFKLANLSVKISENDIYKNKRFHLSLSSFYTQLKVFRKQVQELEI